MTCALVLAWPDGTRIEVLAPIVKDVPFAKSLELNAGRRAHPVELLLPLTARHFVIDESDEPEIERLSPPDDDLPMNQPVVDAIEINGHAQTPGPS